MDRAIWPEPGGYGAITSTTGIDDVGGVGLGHRVRNDVIVIAVAGVALAAATAGLGLHHRIAPGTADLPETVQLLVVLAVVIPLACLVFAVRRERDARRVRQRLLHLSLHDHLTGLPNRRRLIGWVTEAVETARGSNNQAVVLFIDLDRFKRVNDTYGHEVGDRLMHQVAQRLRRLLPPTDRLVRFGGDEFVIVTTTTGGRAASERLGRQIVEELERPFMIGNETMRISASVGVALAERRDAPPAAVIHDADVAMYNAKSLGAGRVTVFDRTLTGTLTPATAEARVRHALEAGEFHLHYQPVVDLDTGRIVAAEALLRWISQERGTMAPGEFVPILEQTGLIVPVGTWVLQEACREAARLGAAFPGEPPLGITVNVSARQVAQVGFADVVRAAVHDAGIPAHQIHLEITEGSLVHDVDSAWATLRQAKAMGVHLALDDFGTGYSSLTYLRRFSLDMVKIDKSFIDGLGSSHEDRAIVEHVVAMAHELGLTTVAEGVEGPEQLAWLRDLGCRMAQGFALSRPLAPADLEALLVRRRAMPFQVAGMPQAPVDLEVASVLDLSSFGGDPSTDPMPPVAHPSIHLPPRRARREPATTPALPRLREYRPSASETF